MKIINNSIYIYDILIMMIHSNVLAPLGFFGLFQGGLFSSRNGPVLTVQSEIGQALHAAGQNADDDGLAGRLFPTN